MDRTYGSPHLPPCPHCGAEHAEDKLVCPETGKTLPLQGRLLDGKFRLVARLGRGGMGEVWRAENVLVHRTVAIKLLHAEYANNMTTLDRFRHEATAAGRIRNPHICDILDLGQSQLGPYIVMELMNGRSLGELLDQTGRLDPGLAVLIVRQALEGLAAAHGAGIIHRDIKPENVFLHEPDKGRLLVKLVDFGISKFTEGNTPGKTRQGVLMGTPEYMAPEQAEGAANVDARSDIWAMGVILFRCLTGREPFLGPTLAATLANVTLREPMSPDALVPDLDPGLVQIVMGCLVKDRERRIQSAVELSGRLAPFERLPSGDSLKEVISARDLPPLEDAPPATGLETTAPRPILDTSAPVEPARVGETWNTDLAAAPGGGRTWNADLSGAKPAAADDSWTLSGTDFRAERPESSLSPGGGGRWLVWGVLVLLLGGGGYIAYQTMTAGGGEADGDGGTTTVAVTGGTTTGEDADDGGPDVVARMDAGVRADASPEPESTGAETGGGSSGGGEDDSGAGEEGGDDGGGDDGGDEGPDSSGDGGKTSGGSNTGGSTRPRPDLSRVQKIGNLYVPQGRPPRLNHAAAVRHCRKLKQAHFAKLSGWHLPSDAELRRVASVLERTRYWTKARANDQAKAFNNMNGTLAWANVSSSVRALCVSARR